MKIVVFNPQNDFSNELQKKLSTLGIVVYTKDRGELPITKLLDLAKGADIIACDPDPLGGFEKGKEVLTKIMESLSNLKGVCLSTGSFDWVDLEYTKKRKLPVSNIPGYSTESVAEHTIAYLLGAMKRIFISDRRTAKGKYVLQQGLELKGKTLGIIGLGSIGRATALLAKKLGMKVIAYNRTKKTMKGVKIVTLNQLLKESDAISFHTTRKDTKQNMIGKIEFSKMKKGVFIINTTPDLQLINEKAMTDALKSGQVDTYISDAPFKNLENAIGFHFFGWYTKEALENLYNIWVDNIVALAKGKPQNRVV